MVKNIAYETSYGTLELEYVAKKLAFNFSKLFTDMLRMKIITTIVRSRFQLTSTGA